MTSETPLSIGALIQRLRDQELAQIASEVGAGRTDTILKALDERGRASELIEQQYTGRYPFELLQNADDAAATTGSGRVRFVATQHALIVGDNGAGFGPEQVRAICGLGRSSKDPAKSIGNKGLGFKSVGEITEGPQILSGGAAFGFDARGARELVVSLAGSLPERQRLPVYAFPLPVDLEDLRSDRDVIERMHADGYGTVFRLPYRAGIDRDAVASHLRTTLTPRLLLFLKNTRSLEVDAGTFSFAALGSRQSGAVADEVVIKTGGKTEHWRVYQRVVPIPDRELVRPLGDLWTEVESVMVAAAVNIADDGTARREGAYPLHVYFPSQEATGLGFILQGDFALELDRRRVSRSPQAAPYNDWLAQQLADLVAETVAPDLAKTGGSDAATLMAPIAPAAEFGATCWAQVLERLRTSAFIACVDGRVRRPAEALLLPGSVPDAGDLHALLTPDGRHRLVAAAIEADRPARRFLCEDLEVEQLLVESGLTRLQLPPTDADALYRLLVSWADVGRLQDFATGLGELPVVPLTDGRWVPPSSGVYLPGQRDEVALPPELPVSVAAVPAVKRATELLLAAGVRAWGWRDIIQDTILPLLTDPATEHLRRTRALDVLRAYRRSPRSGDQTIASQVGRVFLPACRAGAPLAGTVLRPANTLYFPAAWLGQDHLERIYGPFGEPEFLDHAPPDDADERTKERDFLDWLGVADCPRLDAVVTGDRNRYLIGSSVHPHSRSQPRWQEWCDRLDVDEASRCSQGHTASQQLRSSFALDRFDAVVACGDAERLSALWDELARKWSTQFRPGMVAVFHCQHGGHHGERDRQVPSLLAHTLQESRWVPCNKHDQRELVRPDDAWRVAPDTPERLRRHIAVLPPARATIEHATLIADLGVVDAARPCPESLMVLLQTLSRSVAPDEVPNRDLVESARWAMRNLEEALTPDLLSASIEVPLLARRADRYLFTTTPLVAEDPLLADTFVEDHPILNADRGLTRLYDACRLRRLDREVRVTPHPHVLLDDDTQRIKQRLVGASPYLVALAASEVPSRVEDVVRGLKTLEVLACMNLVVRYEFDGSIRERDEAVTFIATRVEQVGSRRRRIGTAHLEVADSGVEPDWYRFGRQLADFLRVPGLGDAFAIILTGDEESRRQYLASHQIVDELVADARIQMHEPDSEAFVDLALVPMLSTEADPTAVAAPETPLEPGPVDPDPSLGTAATDGAVVPVLPSLDLESIEIVDAAPGAILEMRQREGARESVLGPSGPVDQAARDRIQRLIGDRGEEAAFTAERRRVRALGFDQDAVVWRSKERPFAPYDIESLDDDGQRIFVEVKATTDSDPCAPFDISAAELQEAVARRSRYFIYRVTDAHTDAPRITRFQDPMRWISEQTAVLTMSGAKMRFSALPPEKANNP